MATYTDVHGDMLAPAGILQERPPAEELSGPINASVQVFGSQDFKRYSPGHMFALHLYRVASRYRNS